MITSKAMSITSTFKHKWLLQSKLDEHYQNNILVSKQQVVPMSVQQRLEPLFSDHGFTCLLEAGENRSKLPILSSLK